jgi:two-component system, OmpR family, alkaline phosphatase synthesis response regulator PhoP
MPHQLFLVEDDPHLVRALADLFKSNGYELDVAADGVAAVKITRARSFDLVILDVALPLLNGFEVCNEMRRAGIETPILMLTARDQVQDKILGFRSGADDYVTKPFDVNELLVRVEALIRRTSKSGRVESIEYEFGDIHVNFAELQLKRADHTVSLSEREGRLLRYFVDNRGKIISRESLLERVWGYSTAPYTRTVDVHILRLRQKVEDDPKNPKFIVTVHGLGYRFDG